MNDAMVRKDYARVVDLTNPKVIDCPAAVKMLKNMSARWMKWAQGVKLLASAPTSAIPA